MGYEWKFSQSEAPTTAFYVYKETRGPSDEQRTARADRRRIHHAVRETVDMCNFVGDSMGDLSLDRKRRGSFFAGAADLTRDQEFAHASYQHIDVWRSIRRTVCDKTWASMLSERRQRGALCGGYDAVAALTTRCRDGTGRVRVIGIQVSDLAVPAGWAV